MVQSDFDFHAQGQRPYAHDHVVAIKDILLLQEHILVTADNVVQEDRLAGFNNEHRRVTLKPWLCREKVILNFRNRAPHYTPIILELPRRGLRRIFPVAKEGHTAVILDHLKGVGERFVRCALYPSVDDVAALRAGPARISPHVACHCDQCQGR